MAARNLTANCAICNHKPKDPDSGDCPCETKALRKAIEQAEKKWLDSWMSRIHDWVTNAAVRYITATFEALKQRRLQAYTTYVHSLPYYRDYRQWRGRPPLHPPVLAHLMQQLKQADADLQRGVNADWRACVMKYPEVLDHYYQQVEVALPQGGVPPPFGGHGAPMHSGASYVSGTGGREDRRSGGGRSSVPPGAFAEETLTRRTSHRDSKRNSRDSASYVVSGRGSKPAAPTPPVAPGYPYQFGL